MKKMKGLKLNNLNVLDRAEMKKITGGGNFDWRLCMATCEGDYLVTNCDPRCAGDWTGQCLDDCEKEATSWCDNYCLQGT